MYLICHDGKGSGEQDRAGCRDESEVRHNDFVDGTDLKSGHHDPSRRTWASREMV
jgi:hypothetical protein